MRRVLSAEARAFRLQLLNALWPVRDPRCAYISEDAFVGVCPLCGAAVGVRFAGHAARAELACRGGCTEDEVAAHLGLAVRP